MRNITSIDSITSIWCFWFFHHVYFTLLILCLNEASKTQCGMRWFNHLHLFQLTCQRDKVLLLWSRSVNYHIMELSCVSAFMTGDELLLFFSSLASWDTMTGPVWWLAAFLLSRSDHSVMSDQSKHQGWQDVGMTARPVFQRGLDVQKPKDPLTSQLTRMLWSLSVFFYCPAHKVFMSHQLSLEVQPLKKKFKRV